MWPRVNGEGISGLWYGGAGEGGGVKVRGGGAGGWMGAAALSSPCLLTDGPRKERGLSVLFHPSLISIVKRCLKRQAHATHHTNVELLLFFGEKHSNQFHGCLCHCLFHHKIPTTDTVLFASSTKYFDPDPGHACSVLKSSILASPN